MKLLLLSACIGQLAILGLLLPHCLEGNALKSAIRNPQSAITHCPESRAGHVSPARGTGQVSSACAESGQAAVPPGCAGDAAEAGPGLPPARACQALDSPMEAVRPVLIAICMVETRGGRNLRRGDRGRAAGPLQQHAEHWRRGCRAIGVGWPWPGSRGFAPVLGRDVERAFHVALANWLLDCRPLVNRACAEAADGGLTPATVEALARRFRCPNDPGRPSNDRYAAKVLTAWEAQQ